MATKDAPDDGLTLLPIVIGVIVLAMFLYFGTGDFLHLKFFNFETIFNRIADSSGSTARSIVSRNTWTIISSISAILSLFFITIIVFSAVRIREMQVNDKRFVEFMTQKASERQREEEGRTNPRWNHILSLAASENESDWRLSIIEADSMLDDYLKEKGFFGTTMADRLKSSREGGAFQTSKNAFEAHEIRNKIAHEGINFALSQMETRRIMRLYESVFEEFGLI